MSNVTDPMAYSAFGKLFCLQCGAPLGPELRHVERPSLLSRIKVVEPAVRTSAGWIAEDEFPFTIGAHPG